VTSTRPGLTTEALFRRSIAGLAAIAVFGTGVELAMLHHWKTPVQLIPWICLATLVVALGLTLVAPSRPAILVARVLGGAVAGASLFGVFEHVEGNYNAGPLDARYAATWDTMSGAARWWEAASGGVGPAAPLAPGALALAAICGFLVGLRHPVLRKCTLGSAGRGRVPPEVAWRRG
jgi:hypothetical protein